MVELKEGAQVSDTEGDANQETESRAANTTHPGQGGLAEEPDDGLDEFEHFRFEG